MSNLSNCKARWQTCLFPSSLVLCSPLLKCAHSEGVSRTSSAGDHQDVHTEAEGRPRQPQVQRGPCNRVGEGDRRGRAPWQANLGLCL